MGTGELTSSSPLRYCQKPVAIPSNTAKKIARQLIEHGEVPRGFLGIALKELDGPDAKTLGLADGGVVVRNVVPGEPAHQAGMKAGDVVVRVNQEPLSVQQPVRHFRQLIVDVAPDSEVTLEILRGGHRQSLKVKVGKRPANLP